MIIARAFCVSFVMCSDRHFEMELAARLSFSAARFNAPRSAGLYTSRMSRHTSAAASRMIDFLKRPEDHASRIPRGRAEVPFG